MAKTKFTLNPAPTFKKKVPLPVPGAGFEEVEFTFKHRIKEEFKEFVESLAERSDDVQILLDIACGWELEDAFNQENIDRMVEGYVGSARAVLGTYIEELSKARLGN
ncbi:phage tail assembly chaperone [Achromobacter spanius]|uniref:Phage tail assembly chaperone n=1 Tax=Achromobacter spanius TaxID=217203 RepID=A0AAW3HY99_9BURK|nr:phage tail assembly chaperone [Achromobacter spanius]KNE25249.1 hypothetical protein AFM18_23205 [Achromobacter spanius]